MSKKRLRIFAGPNGSGKSTIFEAVNSRFKCPHFVNADLIERQLSGNGRFSFDDFNVFVREGVFREAFRESGLYEKNQQEYGTSEDIYNSIKVTKQNNLTLDKHLVNSYFAAFVADFLRFNMLNIVENFSVETVMSDPSKLDYMRTAAKMGYRIYLYFVSTKDVSINLDRISQRKEEGGHGVPEDKTRSRYERSLSLLYEAMTLSDRTYFFDNSGEQWELLAEWDGGLGDLTLKVDSVPSWFNNYLLIKLA